MAKARDIPGLDARMPFARGRGGDGRRPRGGAVRAVRERARHHRHRARPRHAGREPPPARGARDLRAVLPGGRVQAAPARGQGARRRARRPPRPGRAPRPAREARGLAPQGQPPGCRGLRRARPRRAGAGQRDPRRRARPRRADRPAPAARAPRLAGRRARGAGGAVLADGGRRRGGGRAGARGRRGRGRGGRRRARPGHDGRAHAAPANGSDPSGNGAGA